MDKNQSVKQNKRKRETTIDDLDNEAIACILYRLPVEKIAQSKVVCKRWMWLVQQYVHAIQYTIMDDEKGYTMRIMSTKPTAHNSSKVACVFQRHQDYDHLYLYEYDEMEGVGVSKYKFMRRRLLKTPLSKFNLLGSANGLVCLYGCDFNGSSKVEGPACLFNPVTDEYVLLPHLRTKYPCTQIGYGFGYLQSIYKYKLVRLYKKNADGSDVVYYDVITIGDIKEYVITIGDTKERRYVNEGWRVKGGYSTDFDTCSARGVFWNGSLHWKKKNGAVAIFNLEEEHFLADCDPPDYEDLEDERDYSRSIVGVSLTGDSLFYAVSHVDTEVFDLWTLGTLDGKFWRWTRDLTVGKRSIPYALTVSAEYIRFSEDTGTLQVYRDDIHNPWMQFVRYQDSGWKELVVKDGLCDGAYLHQEYVTCLKDLGCVSTKTMALQTDVSANRRFVIFEGDDYKHLFFTEFDIKCLDIYKCMKRGQIRTRFSEFILVGSINGLVCIYGFDSDDFLETTQGPASVFNPVTNEFLILPKIDKVSCVEIGYGFGYVAAKNIYKIIRLYKTWDDGCNDLHVDVVTLGCDLDWRYKGRYSIGIEFETPSLNGIFWNGSLLWRILSGGKLVAFDLEDERIHVYDPPPKSSGYEGFADDDYYKSVIGVSLGGILYYATAHVESITFDVWLMQMIDNSEGQWTQFLQIEQERVPFSLTINMEWIRYHRGTLQVFQGYAWTDLLVQDGLRVGVFPHKPSYVSVKDLGGQEGWVKEESDK